MQCGYRLCTDKRIVKVPYRVSILVNLSLSVAISHKLESIVASVCNIEVFMPDPLHHFKIMEPTPRSDCGNRAVSFSIFEQ
jgi:hypothetical protein